MNLKLISIGVVVMLAVQTSRAEVTLTGTATTDYDFRGISQTEGDPALQASIDYAGETFYASLWGSNVDFDGTSTYKDGSEFAAAVDGNIEVDLVAGFAGETGGGWRWDVGVTDYLYPGSEDSDIESQIEDYIEFFVGGGYGPLDIKYWYSPDLYDSSETASYLEGNLNFSLTETLGLTVHAGYNFGDYFDELEDAGEFEPYVDFSVGMTYTVGHFDFELKGVHNFIDSDFEIENGPNSNDDRLILSVSTTYPWAEDEK